MFQNYENQIYIFYYYYKSAENQHLQKKLLIPTEFYSFLTVVIWAWAKFSNLLQIKTNEKSWNSIAEINQIVFKNPIWKFLISHDTH